MTTKRHHQATAALNQLVSDGRMSDAEVFLLRQRIDESLASPTPRVFRMRSLVALACVAMAMVVAGVVSLRPEATEPLWYEVRTGAMCAEQDARSVTAAAGCAGGMDLVVGGDEVHLQPGAALTNLGPALRIAKGRASFTIQRRPSGAAPFTLVVSGGRIIVLGTHFAVRQGTHDGDVALHEGRVSFEWADGDRTEIVAGETLSWPRSVVEPSVDANPPVKQPDSRPHRALQSPSEAPQPELAGLRQVMDRLSQLRGQDRYAEAIELLRAVENRADFTMVQRARLAFELGLILERQGATREVCAHWRLFVQKFPKDTHAPAVQAKLDTCSGRK